jgi:CheY-like chemotaxis protein
VVALGSDIASASTRRARVLVVDDDELMRELLKLHLTNHGFEVALAEDAIVAGHLILRRPPDLILLDVHMPYMNGYQLAAALKADELTRSIPIVFLTTDEAVAEHAWKLGAAAYLNKPVTLERLLQVVGMFASSTAMLE